MNEQSVSAKGRLNDVSTFAKIIYALPGLSYRAVETFDNTFQIKFFVDDVRIEPMRFGMIHASVRAIETILFPFWGYLMDTYTVKKGFFKGRRRMYYLIWAPIKAIALILLYMPPRHVSMTSIVSTYVVCALLHGLFPLGIPWMALGAEVSQDNATRSSVFAWRAVFSAAGRILGAAAPAILVARYHGDHFSAFGQFALYCGIATIISFWILGMFTDYTPKEADRFKGIEKQPWKLWEQPTYENRPDLPFVPGLRNCISNIPFMVLLIGHSVSALAGMFSEGLLPFYVQNVLQPQQYEMWISIILIVGLSSAMLATPFWMWVSCESSRACSRAEILRRGHRKIDVNDYFFLPQEWHSNPSFRKSAMSNASNAGPLANVDKRFTWLAGWVLALPASIVMYCFVGKGDEILFALCHAWIGLTAGGVHYLHRPIRADCIDYDELHIGLRREAQFVCYMEMIPRWLHIPSSAVSMSILASFGYRAGGARGTVQGDGVIFALKVMVILVPACCSIISWCIISAFYPITDAMHSKIVAGLQCHSEGKSAIDPITDMTIPAPSTLEAFRGPNCLFDTFSTKTLLSILKKRMEKKTERNNIENTENRGNDDVDDDGESKSLLSGQNTSLQSSSSELYTYDDRYPSSKNCCDCANNLDLREYWYSIFWISVCFFAACSYAYGISRRRRKDAVAIIGLLIVSVSAVMITYHTLRVKPAKMLEHDKKVTIEQIQTYLTVSKIYTILDLCVYITSNTNDCLISNYEFSSYLGRNEVVYGLKVEQGGDKISIK